MSRPKKTKTKYTWVPWSNEERARAVECYKNGMIATEIAETLNNEFYEGDPVRNKQKVQRIIRHARHNGEELESQYWHRHQWSDEELTYLYKLYKENVKSYPQIAEELNEKFHNSQVVRKKSGVHYGLNLVYQRGLEW